MSIGEERQRGIENVTTVALKKVTLLLNCLAQSREVRIEACIHVWIERLLFYLCHDGLL